MRILSGNSNVMLAERICTYLKTDPCRARVERYPDGEVRVRILESIRGDDVFIIQSTFPPAENIVELLLLIDAARRASSRRITAIIPYFGYSRQDKKDEPRVPISAKLMADVISKAGADRIVTIDLHTEQIPGFFNIPFDHLYSSYNAVNYFSEMKIDELAVLSPNLGRISKARFFAKQLGDLPLAAIDKRGKSGIGEKFNVIGDVGGKNVLIVDDIIDTGKTIENAIKTVVENGAKKIFVYCAHPLLSKDSVEKMENLPIEQFVYSDTIPVKKDKMRSFFREISVSSIIGEAVLRIHEEASLSSLFL
ncbi:ribose-phosphate pyrophosphokinase [candidate division WOR-3 bacterium]|nr:ribose-phosphate pyrophosphokinase [candidate division WOR-3 bacterium]